MFHILFKLSHFIFCLIRLIFFEVMDFVPEGEIKRNHIFIFLSDYLLIAWYFVQLVEISQFIGQSFWKQFVVILWGSDVLGENGALLQSFLNILWVEPVVTGLVFKNLKDSAPVDFSDIFFMQMLGQIGIVDLIGSIPFDLILL